VRWGSWCGDSHDCVSESLSEALKAITVSTELVEEELKPHLDVLLTLLLEKSEFTPMCSLTTIYKSVYLSAHQSINASFHPYLYVHWLQHPILVPWSSIQETKKSWSHVKVTCFCQMPYCVRASLSVTLITTCSSCCELLFASASLK